MKINNVFEVDDSGVTTWVAASIDIGMDKVKEWYENECDTEIDGIKVDTECKGIWDEINSIQSLIDFMYEKRKPMDANLHNGIAFLAKSNLPFETTIGTGSEQIKVKRDNFTLWVFLNLSEIEITEYIAIIACDDF